MKKNAQKLVAAALASALALAGAAAPALAAEAGNQAEPALVAQSQEIGAYAALDIAQDYVGIPDRSLAWADWQYVTYADHACYEVRLAERDWWNGRYWVAGDTWVVEVGCVTGAVYAAWTE